MKLYRTYGAIGNIGLMLRGLHPRLYYFAFIRLFRKFVPPLPILNNSYMLCSRSNEQKKRRCGLKPQRRKDRKILHEMLGKMGNFVPFARFVFEKNKQKCVFTINHENNIFQDMLLTPLNRRLIMAHEDSK